MFTFEQLFAADPANPANIAQNAVVTIFEPGDPTQTPLAITDPSGTPLPNPIPVNANGFGPAFAHATLDRVAWAGGGFTAFMTSYEGMKNEAVDARTAAQEAAATAGAEAAVVATAAIGDATADAEAAATSAATAQAAAAASATAAANSAALVAAPADTAIAAAITGSGATKAALAARDTLNILDYGVTRGTTTSQTVAIKAALDANPGAAFYFPPGKYRLDTGLVITKGNSIITHPGTEFYAGAAMTTMITWARDTAGYDEDKSFTGGGLINGNLLAQRGLSLSKLICFKLEWIFFKDCINRGLVTEAGLGAELLASRLRFYNSGTTNVTDNIAIEAKMGDSHFRDIIVRNWTTAIKDTSANRWDRVHPWIDQDTQAQPQMTTRYPSSIGFDITGASDLVSCVSDTYRYAYKLRSNGTGFTAPPRLLNCRAMWAVDPMLPTALALANPAYVLDNTDSVGALSDRLTCTGSNTAPANFINGPITNLTTRRTYSYGYVKGAQGTTNDPLDYIGGIQQGTFTFTPTIIGSNSAGTHTYTIQSGRMVVTGDEVTYYIRVAGTLDTTTAFAGVFRLGGIPLPNGSTNTRDASGSIGVATNIMAGGAANYAGSAVNLRVLSPVTATGNNELDIPGQALRGKTIDLMFTITMTHYRA